MALPKEHALACVFDVIVLGTGLIESVASGYAKARTSPDMRKFCVCVQCFREGWAEGLVP